MDTAALDWLTDRVLRAEAREEPTAPAALRLLLRRYAATGREDVGEAIGRALARALDYIAHRDPAALKGPSYTSQDAAVDDVARPVEGRDAEDWLAMFAEAAALTEDERLPAVVLTLVTSLQRAWPSRETITSAMRSVDASLAAARVLDHLHVEQVIRAAIDELERVVGLVYRPGEPIAHRLLRPDEADGDLQDHVCSASALLAAHAVTDRLPYSMLAEELMQFSRRTWWDEARSCFRGTLNLEPGTLNPELFALNCEVARVLCRLAALHRDDDYRRAAVVAAHSDYSSHAERILASLSPAYREHGLTAAIYGLALDEWLSLR